MCGHDPRTAGGNRRLRCSTNIRIRGNSTSCKYPHDSIAVAVDVKLGVPSGYSNRLDAPKCLIYGHVRVFQVNNDVCLFLYTRNVCLHLITSIRGG